MRSAGALPLCLLAVLLPLPIAFGATSYCSGAGCDPSNGAYLPPYTANFLPGGVYDTTTTDGVLFHVNWTGFPTGVNHWRYAFHGSVVGSLQEMSDGCNISSLTDYSGEGCGLVTWSAAQPGELICITVQDDNSGFGEPWMAFMVSGGPLPDSSHSGFAVCWQKAAPPPLAYFPLKGTRGSLDMSLNPYTAPVASVFDHHVTKDSTGIYFYRCDGAVQAFNPGDLGVGDAVPCSKNAYKNALGNPFSVNGHYIGTAGSAVLNYEGHPGFDFRAQCSQDTQKRCILKTGTNVYAPTGGTIHYPSTMVGLCSQKDCASKWHVMQLVPATAPNLLIYYLHLSTYKSPGTFTAMDPSPAPGCQSTVTLPIPDGSVVGAGCLIGQSGNTSPQAIDPHLHFEVQQVLPRGTFASSLRCTVNGAPMACVPVDPYGWSGGACSPDPYASSPGVVNAPLWNFPSYLSASAECFPSQTVGTTSTPLFVTLTNAAPTTLTISSITVIGSNTSDFSVGTCALSLAPGQTCTLAITFSPTQIGTRSALVSITGADGGSPRAVSLAVSLFGTGT